MADALRPEHAKRLEDPSRLEALPQAAVVELLRLSGAETVVDYGAGTGIYTVAVAEALPDGRVLAVEALPRARGAAAREDHARAGGPAERCRDG